MQNIVQTFLSLTAADLMTKAVVMIPQEASLQHAAHLLGQARITGAPVIDADGRCVGVLSASDFVLWAEKGEHAARRRPEAEAAPVLAWQLPSGEQPARESVHRFMTSDPVTASPGTSIGDLARMMVDAHIHRIVIVDPEHRPLGIVSSTDILAAVARVAQEAERERPSGGGVARR
ncbi:MAG: CBS domain-containing protein [Gemmataceae bacterium]|nr:CBS domain-containing protein [Gemmataceae bacterium]MDW8266134.1 CBS domain-containing protein [Gemmataceae bacterium]